MTAQDVAEIAATLNLSTEELFHEALVSLLREKKRQVVQDRLEILARYGAASIGELEARIREGAVVEHPAWEDLITVENLDARLEELDGHLASLR